MGIHVNDPAVDETCPLYYCWWWLSQAGSFHLTLHIIISLSSYVTSWYSPVAIFLLVQPAIDIWVT